jgi:hypothetical protein
MVDRMSKGWRLRRDGPRRPIRKNMGKRQEKSAASIYLSGQA